MSNRRYRKFIKGIVNKIRGLETSVSIGRNVNIVNSTLGRFVHLAHHADLLNSTVGNRTSIGRYSIIRNTDIGSYCAISWNVTIGADHHPTERISGSAAFFRSVFGLVNKDSSKGDVKRCIIGNDVLISTDVTIIAGVSIGDGAIIGAGAVVTKDIPSYTIAVGNPAKVIKTRFNNRIIQKLETLSWWNLSDDFLINHSKLFQVPVTEEILDSLLNDKDK